MLQKRKGFMETSISVFFRTLISTPEKFLNRFFIYTIIILTFADLF